MQQVIGIIGGASGCSLSSELHKRGMKVAAVIGKPMEPGYDIADYVLVCDLTKHDRIIEFFKNLNVKNVILGTGPFVAIELSRELIDNGFQMNIDLEKFELCKNKYVLNNLLREQEITIPADRLITGDDELSTVAETISYPIVVKSIKDIVAPQKIDNKETFIKIVSEMLSKEDSIMAEEYIRGNDVTVFVSNSDELFIRPIYWSKGLEDELKGFGDSWSEPLSKEREEKLIEWCKKINEIVKIPGVYRIDLIVANDTFYFFEINTLLVSSLASSSYAIKFFQAEVNRAQYIIDYALKKFGIGADRVAKKLTITEDDCLVNSYDVNNLYVRKSDVKQLYKNIIYDYGINLFIKYLNAQPGIGEFDKEIAKNVLLCMLSSDAEEIILCKPVDLVGKIVIEAAKFLHKPFAVIDKSFGIIGGLPENISLI